MVCHAEPVEKEQDYKLTPPGSGVPILPPLAKGRIQEGWLVLLSLRAVLVVTRGDIPRLLPGVLVTDVLRPARNCRSFLLPAGVPQGHRILIQHVGKSYGPPFF